jgi:hypothetical protein
MSSPYPHRERIFGTAPVLGIVLSIILAGCATSEKSADQGGIGTYYTLRLGKTVNNPQPLPAYTPVLVDWHKSDGTTAEKPAFRAYDFNRDGRFDYVEVLRDDGTVQASIFDFDFDGRIDLLKKP